MNKMRKIVEIIADDQERAKWKLVKAKHFPCNKLGYCPYGCLVEYFPCEGDEMSWNGIHLDWIKPLKNAKECPSFGHDCPVFYVSEKLVRK
jgi:hypothetical protein